MTSSTQSQTTSAAKAAGRTATGKDTRMNLTISTAISSGPSRKRNSLLLAAGAAVLALSAVATFGGSSTTVTEPAVVAANTAPVVRETRAPDTYVYVVGTPAEAAALTSAISSDQAQLDPASDVERRVVTVRSVEDELLLGEAQREAMQHGGRVDVVDLRNLATATSPAINVLREATPETIAAWSAQEIMAHAAQ